MYNRREDGYLRVPSPAVTRRQVRSRNTGSAYSDEPFLDSRLRGRDPSPGGLGRLSTSAPTGGDASPFGRRYRDYVDSRGYVTSGSGYVTSASGMRARDTFPRDGRMTSAANNYVNGDAWAQPSRGRPRSFPEQRGAYLSELPSHRGYAPSPQGQRHDLSSEYRRKGQGHHYDPASPNSEETQSSVTLTAEGVARMGIGTEMLEGSFTCDDGYTWHSALTCYLCAQLFRRPRILPCGHTFCSECLAQLKDESLREGRRLPGGHASCTWERRQKTDVGTQFVCPMPECRYSMRLINLSKWSTRNKTVAEAVDAVRKMYESREDACTQTDITMESVLVTIPRSFVQETPSPGSERGLMRRNSASLVDRMVHRALSMDSLSRNYIPQQHVTWRSYAAMLGMHILQQVLHT